MDELLGKQPLLEEYTRENMNVLPIYMASIIQECSSSSDSQSDEELDILLEYYKSVKTHVPRNSIKNYVENVHSYTDAEFKCHFRLRKETFIFLLELLTPLLETRSRHHGRYPISPEKQLLITIWMLATPNSYRCISDRFDVSKSTAWHCVQRVVKALYGHLHTFIKWPSADEAKETWTVIERKHGFPKVIGAIDGTHIRIAAPSKNSESYINRKGYHSLQLQVVCDENLKFIHCYCGQVGSVHDMRVFRLSGFQDMLVPTNFPEDSHILGDAAYTIHKHLLVPFKDNGQLSEAQLRYNYCHSAARMMVERSLALLKGRFRSILDKLPITRTDLISKYVVACCVMHNICILRNDLIDIPIVVNDNHENMRRQFGEAANLQANEEGIAKRNAIVYLLSQRNN